MPGSSVPRDVCPTCGLRNPGPEHRAYRPMLCSEEGERERDRALNVRRDRLEAAVPDYKELKVHGTSINQIKALEEALLAALDASRAEEWHHPDDPPPEPEPTALTEERTTMARPDHPSEQTHREAVDVARKLVEDDKTSTWTGILQRSHGQIRPWADSPSMPGSSVPRDVAEVILEASRAEPREGNVLDGLPDDLAAILRDQSVIVQKDMKVWELIGKWATAPSNTASGPVPGEGEADERVTPFRTRDERGQSAWKVQHSEAIARLAGDYDDPHVDVAVFVPERLLAEERAKTQRLKGKIERLEARLDDRDADYLRRQETEQRDG